jgi:hypothetical protein
MKMKGQAPSLVTVVVGGVMALIISAIIIYAVGFPVLTSLNTSGNIPASQLPNFNTVLLLLGVMVIIVALVVFLFITRLVG